MSLTTVEPHSGASPIESAQSTPRWSSRSAWRASSLCLIFLVWAVLQMGGLFRPGLLDDVDSVYTQIAREMLLRHDFVTPTIDGIRFFDKPPLLYWMAAGSMRLFGVHDWAARLPLTLGVLALLLAVYALGNRLFAAVSPWQHPDRGGLYAALATATSLGPYLYTRFYIPDILIALWMTLSVHLLLLALDRIEQQRSTLLSSLALAAVMALDVLTKGLIGVVFPLAFVLLYLACTRRLSLLARLHIPAATAVFLVLAAPWHILAARRNPAIAMPPRLGLPGHAGWAWFYLYNEHIARFLGRRIPHDYGQVPIPLFWLLLLLWLFPWVAWVPAAVRNALRDLRTPLSTASGSALLLGSDIDFSHAAVPQAPPPAGSWAWPPVRWRRGLTDQAYRSPAVVSQAGVSQVASSLGVSQAAANQAAANPAIAGRWCSTLEAPDRRREAALSLLLWPAIILGFFTLSSRQEYYHLPALPALALLVGGLLASADRSASYRDPDCHWDRDRAAAPVDIRPGGQASTEGQVLRGSLWLLVPLGAVLAAMCAYFAWTAPPPPQGATLTDLLSSNPALYNLSLGHIFDLTAQAMGFFRGPLLTVSAGMLALGPVAHLLRRTPWLPRSQRGWAANLLVAGAMTAVLLAAHEGLVRFYPILGSKQLALAIDSKLQPGDLVVIDGELTAGSTLLFYTPGMGDPATGRHVLLVNGRRNGPWFGSFWPDAPRIFLDEAGLHKLWAGSQRVFLLTYDSTRRTADLSRFGPAVSFASAGGKTVLTNRGTP